MDGKVRIIVGHVKT